MAAIVFTELYEMSEDNVAMNYSVRETAWLIDFISADMKQVSGKIPLLYWNAMKSDFKNCCIIYSSVFWKTGKHQFPANRAKLDFKQFFLKNKFPQIQ